MFNFSTWVEVVDPAELVPWYKKQLEDSGFKILRFTDFNFEPFGYTAIFLLAESHLAIHTFPENGTTYIELVSCVKDQFDKFISLNGQRT